MEQLMQQVVSGLGAKVADHKVYAGELTLTVKAQDLIPVLTALKEQYGFDYLSDIYSIDHFRDDWRFEVGYNLMNLGQRKRVRVKTFVQEDKPELETAVGVWPSADWNEREVYDMMGIRFRNHPDLRRIYMPEDFQYFPLRKEFPLIGIPGSIQLPEKDPPKPYK